MIRRVRNTFDWEYMVRFVMAVALLYVAGIALLHTGSRTGRAPQAAIERAAM